MPYPSGNVQQSLNDASSRKSRREAGKKGQPDGFAVTGITGKPWVADTDLVSDKATGQNNSNLTS